MEELRIVSVREEADLRQAAGVHSVSWQDSHRSFSSPDFVAAHTPERQYRYLADKAASGSRIFLLLRGNKPIGLVTVTGDLIADLYILPDERNKGYGTVLLQHTMGQCTGSPTLWILENNTGAERLYRRNGFRPTGRVLEHPGGLSEREFIHP
ncbi:MAG: GNAT family N-acetyltransferase [Oscillospiraceae bacterium]|nr:GNAT family N-acetyltransferase [Oscillospiraceae bacterium]